MEYKNAFDKICEFLPHDISLRYVKRGSTYRVRFSRGTHVIVDYPYIDELTELDYATLIAQILRMAFQKLA